MLYIICAINILNGEGRAVFVKQDSLCADKDAKRGTGRNLSEIDDMMRHLVAYGNGMYLAVQGDGTLFVSGEYEPSIAAMARDLGGYKGNRSYVQGYYWDDWEPWTDLLAVYTMVAPDYGFFVGLKKNGRTVAAGYNGQGQCDDINSWYGVKSIVFFGDNAVGLTYTGELLCSGRLKSNDIWAAQKCVKKICPGSKRVSILKETGIVSILEFGDESVFIGEIENSLEGIVDIFVYGGRTYAIDGDGRAFIVGESEFNEIAITACAGIQKIISEYSYTVALTAQKSGSLIFAGKVPAYFEKAKEWKGIKEIVFWNEALIGLTFNGEICISNRDDEFIGGNRDLLLWKKEWGDAIKAWEISLRSQKDSIVSICECGYLLVAITAAGRLLFSGEITSLFARRFTHKFTATYSRDQYCALYEQAENLAKEEADHVAQERKMAEYRQRRVCQYCGGKFSGLIVKTCQECGKRKDY